MRLNDFIKVEGPANLNVQRALRDLLDQFLEWHPHEVLRLAGITGKVDRGRDLLHRSKVVERPFVSDDAGHADDSVLFGAAQRVLEGRRADEFEHFVDAPGTDLLDLSRDCPGVDENLIGSARPQQLTSLGIARRRGNKGAVGLGDRCGRQSYRSCATANQQPLALFETKRLEQRSPCRLEHLWKSAERLPRKFCLDDLHLGCGHAGELGVPAVELPPHAAHRSSDDIAFAELAARRLLYQTDRLNAEDAGKFNAWRMPL